MQAILYIIFAFFFVAGLAGIVHNINHGWGIVLVIAFCVYPSWLPLVIRNLITVMVIGYGIWWMFS
jgi:hypothetical protein